MFKVSVDTETAVNLEVTAVLRRRASCRWLPLVVGSSSERGARSDAVFLQPSIEGAARQAERSGGFADVSAKSRHGLLDENPFHLLEAHLFEVAAGFWLAAQAELGRPDRRAGGEKHGALDRMVELAHVARP